MIGRQDALSRLRAALEEVRRYGHSQVALITGEAGVGKSRLLSEFRARIAEAGLRFYQGNSVTYARMKPLSLIADVLRNVLYIADSDPLEVQREAVQASVMRLELGERGAPLPL